MTETQLNQWRSNMQGNRKHTRTDASVVVDSAVHTYVVFNLARRHISQTTAAKVCGCTPQFINCIIRGTRRSAVIQDRFATQVMGLRDWQDLEHRALLFQERVNQMLEEDKDAM